MAATVEQHLEKLIGQQAITIAALRVEVETLREQLAKLQPKP